MFPIRGIKRGSSPQPGIIRSENGCCARSRCAALCKVLPYLLVTVFPLVAQDIPDRSIHYRPGDWITYPMTRFVTSIDVGYEVVYFGTTEGISRYDFNRRRWESTYTVSDGLENDRIGVVGFDFVTGTLWCATDAGMSFRVSSSLEWRNLSYDILGFGPVHSVGFGDVYIWLVAPEGLFRGDRRQYTFFPASEDDAVRDRVEWKGGRRQRPVMFPSLFAPAGYLFNPEGILTDPQIRRFEVTKAVEDDFFRLWMGTWGMGALVADTRMSELELLPSGPFASRVDFMAWYEDGMWLGGSGAPGDRNAVTRWDMEGGNWEYFESPFIAGLRSDRVTSIAVNGEHIWLGTDEGLSRYNARRGSWRTFTVFDNLWDDRVTSMVFAENTLWVATMSGVNRIDPSTMVIERVKDRRLVRHRIYQLEFDGRSIWAATDRGIFRSSGALDDWSIVSGDPGMVPVEIFAVSAWEDEVWFGTDDGVEVYYTEEERWQGFSSEHYPTGGRIYTVLADSGVVWVGSDDGVLKYIKKENRWRRFTEEDGLPDNDVRWIILDGDNIWFATDRGITKFYWNAPYRID